MYTCRCTWLSAVGAGGCAQTILKQYDGRFLQIFQEIYEAKYRSKFEELGIWRVPPAVPRLPPHTQPCVQTHSL